MTVSTAPGIIPYPGREEGLDLFILGAGLPGGDERAWQSYLQGGVDWEHLQTLAITHQVFPLLYKGLDKLDKSLVPEPVRQRFDALFKVNALRNIRLARELIRVISLLEGAGIEVLPFKGPVLTLQAYGDLSLRSFSDLDLLVSPRDFPRVVEILLNDGLMPDFPSTPGPGRYISLSRRDYRFSGPAAALDFHHRLTQGPSFMDLAGPLHRERVSLELLDRAIRVPSTEHSLLAACINGTKDQWGTLRSIIDVALLLTPNREMNWSFLVEDASRAGCLTMLHVGMELARQVGGVALPNGLVSMGSIQQKAARLARAYLENLGHAKKGTGKLPQVISLSRCLDTPVKRFFYLSYFSFTPTPVDWGLIPLPSRFYFLYYLIRPFRLFSNLVKKILHFFFKKMFHIGR